MEALVESKYQQVKSLLESRNLDEIEPKNLPQPESMKGVKEASEIIAQAIIANHKIAVVGDYDVDGISSTCIMELFFRELGFKNIITRIPNRFDDGYGINEKMIQEIDAELFISVDNGIVAFDVANLCNKLGKRLIITDHHKPLINDDIEILPNAIIINPNQTQCQFIQKSVCGAVVAWYVCAGIKQALQKTPQYKQKATNINMLRYTKFLSLAIIADMMPLTSINRTLFKLGIKEINKLNAPNTLQYSENIAFALLASKYNISANDIGFFIAPLLNSAGRLSDATIVKDFFLSGDRQRVAEIYTQLLWLNTERKRIQSEVFEEAKLPCNSIKSKNVIIAYGSGWNDGVLGIVASRLCDEFQLSAFCFKEEDGLLKGSGRSRNGVNIIASLQQCKDLLHHFGGHSAAAGLALDKENLHIFLQTLEANLIIEPQTDDNCEIIELSVNDITMPLLELIESYEPYGFENPRPLFRLKPAMVENTKIFGKNNEHQILYLQDSSYTANSDTNLKEQDLCAKDLNLQDTKTQNPQDSHAKHTQIKTQNLKQSKQDSGKIPPKCDLNRMCKAIAYFNNDNLIGKVIECDFYLQRNKRYNSTLDDNSEIELVIDEDSIKIVSK